MKKYNLILVIMIMFINVFFVISFIFLKKNSFSEEENRYLTEFKIDSIEEYINDYFPYRVKLIGFKNKIEYYLGKTLINDVYVTKDYLIPNFDDISDKKKEYIIETVNEFSENRNVDLMFVPDSIAINEGKIKCLLGKREEAEIDYLYSRLNTNNINVVDKLKEYNKSRDLYYKSDHHWNSYGAYYAYKEYFSYKGKDSLELDDYDIEVVNNEFYGTSSSKVLGIDIKDEIVLFKRSNNISVNYVYESRIEDSLYNYDYLNTKDKYAMFLDNNHALIEITNNDIKSNNSILVIKNSYANSFIPFLVNHYKRVNVIDLRYYNDVVSDYLVDNKVDDILILYNLNNLYSDLSIVKLK